MCQITPRHIALKLLCIRSKEIDLYTIPNRFPYDFSPSLRLILNIAMSIRYTRFLDTYDVQGSFAFTLTFVTGRGVSESFCGFPGIEISGEKVCSSANTFEGENNGFTLSINDSCKMLSSTTKYKFQLSGRSPWNSLDRLLLVISLLWWYLPF